MPAIALIGCGRWGRHILRDLKTLGCSVSVVASSEPSQDNAKNGNADHIVTSIDSLPQDIEGAIVATPSITHYEIIKSLTRKFGKKIPIYTEKPMCLDVHEARDLVDNHSGQIYVMHKWRYHQGILELARIARDGVLGEVRGVRLHRLGWGNPHRDVDPVWILAPHDVSIVLEILGYIPEVSYGRIDQTAAGIHGLFGMLKSDKHWVNLEVSARSPVNRREVILFCEDGIAMMTDSYKDSIEIHRTSREDLSREPECELIPFENEMPLYRELECFIEYVNSGKNPPKSDVSEGYQVVKTIVELKKIAESGAAFQPP